MLSKNKFPVLDAICEFWTEALEGGERYLYRIQGGMV